MTVTFKEKARSKFIPFSDLNSGDWFISKSNDDVLYLKCVGDDVVTVPRESPGYRPTVMRSTAFQDCRVLQRIDVDIEWSYL